MIIQSTNAIEPIANYPMIIEEESSIFDEVDELIKQYDAKPLMRAEVAISAKQLIDRFNQLVEENLELNLSLVSEGLLRLLKLGIEEVGTEVGVTYRKIGFSYQALGEYRKAIEFYEKYLLIAKETKDKANQRVVYSNLGLAYESLGEYFKSIEYYEKSLQIAQETKDKAGERRAYGNLGDAYQALREYYKAIEFHERSLQISQDLGDQADVGINYENLGVTYKSLGEHQKAIEFYEKALQIAEQLEDRASIWKLYFHLGDTCRLMGKYQNSIEYHEKSLKIILEIGDRKEEGRIYNSIGHSYHYLAKYREADRSYQKSLKIALEFGDQLIEMSNYVKLGNVYQSLSEYRKAIKYHEKGLKVALKIKNRLVELNIYGNLATTYHFLGEPYKAIEFLEKTLKFAIEQKKTVSIGKAYENLGSIYRSLKEYQKAIEYQEKGLQIAIDLKDKKGEGRIYGNIGNTYGSLKNYSKSLEYQEKRLQIALVIGDRRGEGLSYSSLGTIYNSLDEYSKALNYFERALKVFLEIDSQGRTSDSYNNLAFTYMLLEEYQKAEDHYIKSISISSKIQHELKDNSQNQITIFEKQIDSYQSLENLLFQQKKIKESLEITENRRAKALISSISMKFPKDKTNVVKSSLTIAQIQKLAQTIQTTFIVYSLSIEEIRENKKYSIRTWIISSQGNIDFYQLPWDEKLSFDEMSKQLQELVKEVENLSSIKRGGSDELDFDLNDLDLEAELALLNTDPEVEKLAATKQAEKSEKDQIALKLLREEKLRPWYDLLIAPLEKHLSSLGSSVTIIPDGVLSQFPFGAFCDKDGTYLIEKYAISLAPSIKTLELLHKLPQEFPSTSLVVGSPDTGRALDYLEVADKEAAAVSTLVSGSKLLSKKQATISNVSKQMEEARFIHLACHGLAEKKYDKHSVFEGLFKLAPDEEDPEPKPEHGHLYAQQIAALNLKAELVFLSACYSGKGNVKQEGSIGPVWSFLGAGAKSTVATYWPLPDSATTFEMVESFYQGILNTDRASLNKAQVLRQVTLKAMERNRDDFIQWGAFFLSGVSIDAKLD